MPNLKDMILREPDQSVFDECTSTSPVPFHTPPMTVYVYDINGKLLMHFDAPAGCQLEKLAAWCLHDDGFVKYMYNIRAGRLIGKHKRTDFIVEVSSKSEYIKFVGSYDLQLEPVVRSFRIVKGEKK